MQDTKKIRHRTWEVIKHERRSVADTESQKGDTKAYGELIQLHKDYFYRNAFCYVKNVDLAGDVFQEAVTIGMLSIKDLKNPNYFRTWMTRIIYNCANEMFRKAEKEIGSLDAEIQDRAEENGGASREEIIDLHNAVESLEEPYRTIIKQKYFEDKKISEIALIREEQKGLLNQIFPEQKRKLKLILEEG